MKKSFFFILLIIRSLLDFFIKFYASNDRENNGQRTTLAMPTCVYPVCGKIRMLRH